MPDVNSFPNRWSLDLREKIVAEWDLFTLSEQQVMLRGDILPQWDIGL